MDGWRKRRRGEVSWKWNEHTSVRIGEGWIAVLVLVLLVWQLNLLGHKLLYTHNVNKKQ